MRGMRTLGAGLAIILLLVLVVGSTALGVTKVPSGPAVDTLASSKSKGDYLPAHNFKLEIDGIISGGFKEITGLESEIEIVEYRDGTDPIAHKRPGKAKYKNIVLKLDAADPATKVVTDWYNAVARGKDIRKQISIVVFNSDNQEVARYNLFEAWPCRWKAPELNSNSDTFIVEEIEFVVERVERG